ncbi:MAG: FtsX-like permease family protein [Clostridiaceae bacterium]|nr:FtsX-like permease family protein [Clostridiaceae bacterium]MBW4861054.1 FtsX-like permease family protein [Clostridiaceae bacterium]MBW4867679.1 FtsX-like permease family protein [Clostridiaceae bacterium]
MNSFKIAIVNFKRNIKTYGLYVMAMIFSVATYYNFLSMRYNPQFLEHEEASGYIQSTAMSASVLMVIFLVFFIVYSTNFFLNQRKKEIGVYAFMGIDNSKVGFIFASEGLLLGLLSLIIGLGVGILFSKLFMMILAKVALLNMKIDFFISKKAIIGTIIVYSIILMFTFLKGYISIIRSNLIDLINSLKKEEELPKVNYFKGIVSIIIIGIAYYVAINYEKIGFGTSLLTTILLIILGTYWLFGSFFSMIIRHYINKKSFLYKGVNIVSFSNIAFRIKNNYKTLTAVAVLITTCITSFGTVSSLKYYVEKNRKIEVPYTISYVSDNKEQIDKADEIIKKSKNTIKLKERTNFFYVPDNEVVVIKLSDFKDILSGLGVEDREDIISQFNLSKNEVGYIERPQTMMSLIETDGIKIKDKKYDIKVSTKVPLFGNGLNFPCIVVNDKEYEILKANFIEHQFNGIILDNPKNIKDLTFQLAELLSPKESSLYTSFVADASFYDFTGIIYFLGSFLFLVFVFGTGSIIYFKTLSESFRDKGKYEILKKLGMTDLEIYKSVSKQVGISFILPLIVGSIHSIVSILVLSNMMKFNLLIPTIMSIGIFTLAYGIFYIFTIRKFMSIVQQ